MSQRVVTFMLLIGWIITLQSDFHIRETGDCSSKITSDMNVDLTSNVSCMTVLCF